MNERQVSVAPYEPAKHEAALFRFIEKVLGAETCAQRRRIIETMHRTMPGSDRFPLRHVIVDGDRIAGTLGYMPADFLVKGKRVAVRFTHDLLVDPDYRGAGLARRIVDNARAQGDFFPGGMWMTDPCYKIHVACGFDEATPLTTYSLVLDPSAFAGRKQLSAPKALAARLGLGTSSALALRRATRVVRGASLRSIDRFDPVLDQTWTGFASTYGVTRVREAAYLNWKYADHPTLPYRSIIALRGDEPAGYIIWRPALQGADERRAVVTDFLMARNDADTFRQLIARVILDAKAAGMESVSILTTQPWVERSLRGFGFLPRAARNTWVVAGWRNLIPAEWLRDVDAWHVCLGDSDGDIWTGSM